MKYVVDNITAHVAPGGLSLTNATTLSEVSEEEALPEPDPQRLLHRHHITNNHRIFIFFSFFYKKIERALESLEIFFRFPSRKKKKKLKNQTP